MIVLEILFIAFVQVMSVTGDDDDMSFFVPLQGGNSDSKEIPSFGSYFNVPSVYQQNLQHFQPQPRLLHQPVNPYNVLGTSYQGGFQQNHLPLNMGSRVGQVHPLVALAAGNLGKSQESGELMGGAKWFRNLVDIINKQGAVHNDDSSEETDHVLNPFSLVHAQLARDSHASRLEFPVNVVKEDVDSSEEKKNEHSDSSEERKGGLNDGDSGENERSSEGETGSTLRPFPSPATRISASYSPPGPATKNPPSGFKTTLQLFTSQSSPFSQTPTLVRTTGSKLTHSTIRPNYHSSSRTVKPTKPAPSTKAPQSSNPTKPAPSITAPQSSNPTKPAPSTKAPQSSNPTKPAPSTKAPQSSNPTKPAPSITAPQSSNPTKQPTKQTSRTIAPSSSPFTKGTIKPTKSTTAPKTPTNTESSKYSTKQKPTSASSVGWSLKTSTLVKSTTKQSLPPTLFTYYPSTTAPSSSILTTTRLPLTSSTTGRSYPTTRSSSSTTRSSSTTTRLTTTTSSITSTEKPNIPELCQGGQEINGVGYKAHWSDCSKFIQCHFLPDGTVHVVMKSCQHGTHWDQNTLSCTNGNIAHCPYDLCLKDGFDRYPSMTNCRGYWICQNEKSEGYCCPPQHSYDVITSDCVPNSECKDVCGAPNIFDICDKRAVEGRPLVYEQNLPGQGWVQMPCAQGTTFNVNDCMCAWSSQINSTEILCQPELYIPFNGDIRDESGNNNYLQVDGVKVVDGTGHFDGKSLIRVPRFSNAEYGDTFIVKLRYKEEGRGSGAGQLQALVANGDCNKPSSLYMATGQGRVDVGLRTNKGQNASVSIPNNASGWKDAVLMADRNILSGSVNGNTYQTFFAGSIEPSKCALQIGRGTDFKHFTGYMDDITVFLCKPKGF
ncbi:uncharacterized protein LOC106057861 isoform X1 [Biomphalaria glabrata]|uniref:Uncharacterized protein LOC106057861 isoform X1 n=1 Tax=Biomphalaria glabrata TaxID=6526 RepID=A0A9W3BMI8_BIOGL|nr:uncharacterized protein LOC106057861 isoform X1 [Biomphalaria glabrata]XP_055900617.1 uncharacterized protein LOC106057861 isoform X1 [Biomphalaria glabrata]